MEDWLYLGPQNNNNHNNNNNNNNNLSHAGSWAQ
jgi:hypothetical protein